MKINLDCLELDGRHTQTAQVGMMIEVGVPVSDRSPQLQSEESVTLEQVSVKAFWNHYDLGEGNLVLGTQKWV